MRVVLTLCAFTGLRKGDALTLTKAAYDAESGGIAANTAKTGQKVQWPVIGSLRAVLDAAPVHDAITLAATSKGRPW
ncbi:MAG: integrase, partial [Pseudomonadota bacterium]|nr:integrase [Pseudomonadota bacterium]